MAGDDDRNGIPGWAADEGAVGGPSPIPGVDWQTFRNFLTRALNGDETVPSVMIQHVHAALQNGERDLEERGRTWWQDFFLRKAIQDSLRDIDALIGKYNTMADWHHEQAEIARAKMREAAEKLEEVGEFIDSANEVFKEKDKTGRFDRERAIRLLQSRGVNIDPKTDEAAILAELRRQSAKAMDERQTWSDQFNQADADATLHGELEAENRRKAQELVDRRDAIRNGDLDASEEERRLREIAEEYEQDVRCKAAEIEEQRHEQSPPAPSMNETSLEAAKVLRSQDEEAEFLVSLESLKPQFAAAVSNTKPADPDTSPPTPDRPRPSSPVISV